MIKKIHKVIKNPELLKLKTIHFIKNLYYFVRLILIKILSFFFFQKIYKIVVFTPIRSLASSIALVSKTNVEGKFYSLNSFQYGQKYKNKQTLYSNVYRILFKKKFLGYDMGFRISDHSNFDKSHSQFVYITRSNPKITINEPVYLLPYYVTQFAHYIAETLGLLSMYSDLIPDLQNRKLLYIKGTNFTELLINSFPNKNKLLPLEQEVCLKNRIDIIDGVILPSCHPWQSIIYLKSQLKKISFYKKTENVKGIFLTSKRYDRIDNLDQVLDLFGKLNFKILDMNEDLTIENLSEIKNAKIFFCENASVSHIPIIHRDKKYFVFSGKRTANYSDAEYQGGYIFVEIDSPRRIDIDCEIVEQSNKHYLSNKINVDTTKLQVIIEEEFSNLL
jgi:hypothetical protein